MSRPLVPALLLCLAIGIPAGVDAQNSLPAPAKPRRQFVTVTIDGMNSVPLHFKEFPLEELVGKELASVQREENIDYRSRDGLTTVDVLEYRRRTHGFGVMVYPLGASTGPTLVLRGSLEEIPVTRFVIQQADGVERYDLVDGRAYDMGAGVLVSDRSAGWGIGSQAFVIAGLGKLRGERGDGRRYFVEGGGGIMFGPFGVQLAIKFAKNWLDDPREHSFLTVPVTWRGTISF
jgi:hypothetical protein